MSEQKGPTRKPDKNFYYVPPDTSQDNEEEPETILCRIENLECETSSLRFELDELLEALDKVLRIYRAKTVKGS